MCYMQLRLVAESLYHHRELRLPIDSSFRTFPLTVRPIHRSYKNTCLDGITDPSFFNSIPFTDYSRLLVLPLNAALHHEPRYPPWRVVVRFSVCAMAMWQYRGETSTSHLVSL